MSSCSATINKRLPLRIKFARIMLQRNIHSYEERLSSHYDTVSCVPFPIVRRTDRAVIELQPGRA